MALTIVVRSGPEEGPELALTFDAPRIVIGRGEGCEVRLPDASVSHRHASLRQRGAEWVVFDEGSENGTFLGPMRLPPQTAHAVRAGELVRLGRVWLEVRIAPGHPSPSSLAKDVALELVCRGLRAQGEDPGPLVTVVEGPDTGATLSVREAGRVYAVGRGPDVDLVLGDPAAAKRHASLVRRGDALVVQASGGGITLDGTAPSGPSATWRVGHELGIGADILALAFAAVDVLADMERIPVEPVDEVPSPPPGWQSLLPPRRPPPPSRPSLLPHPSLRAPGPFRPPPDRAGCSPTARWCSSRSASSSRA